jgi:hypothetical protein
MSEILEAIKVWEQQNSPTIKGLDVAKQNAISQALNFFNKKFGGEGELMPIIEETVIVETPKTKKSKAKKDDKVENAINQQIMIPQMTQFELMKDDGKLKKGDTGVFAQDYYPPNTFVDAYMNSERIPDFIYNVPFKKIRIIEELPLEEIKQAEEEVLFTDLEELENEIESINFEELENLDKELDDLF